jgi:hypothetical protein
MEISFLTAAFVIETEASPVKAKTAAAQQKKYKQAVIVAP